MTVEQYYMSMKGLLDAARGSKGKIYTQPLTKTLDTRICFNQHPPCYAIPVLTREYSEEDYQLNWNNGKASWIADEQDN